MAVAVRRAAPRQRFFKRCINVNWPFLSNRNMQRHLNVIVVFSRYIFLQISIVQTVIRKNIFLTNSLSVTNINLILWSIRRNNNQWNLAVKSLCKRRIIIQQSRTRSTNYNNWFLQLLGNSQSKKCSTTFVSNTVTFEKRIVSKSNSQRSIARTW